MTCCGWSAVRLRAPRRRNLARRSVLRRFAVDDGLGSSIARVGEAEPLVAIVGHIDEIGLIVTHIDEKGFLWFERSAAGPPVLVGQRVDVRGREGLVPGVVGRKPIHLLELDQRKKVVELKTMHVDLGAADREEAEAMVRVGDPV